jgi:hypothetical protein
LAFCKADDLEAFKNDPENQRIITHFADLIYNAHVQNEFTGDLFESVNADICENLLLVKSIYDEINSKYHPNANGCHIFTDFYYRNGGNKIYINSSNNIKIFSEKILMDSTYY